jgi:hypothetical protein
MDSGKELLPKSSTLLMVISTRFVRGRISVDLVSQMPMSSFADVLISTGSGNKPWRG